MFLMTAKRSKKRLDDLPKFQDIFNELSAAALSCLLSSSASAQVLKKHWLLAQAELLKGLQEVVQMEMENIDNPKPVKRTKIVVN
jgi:hypothetical protein